MFFRITLGKTYLDNFFMCFGNGLRFFWTDSLLDLKVGTAVVTRDDGRLALGRLGALCEQVDYYITENAL